MRLSEGVEWGLHCVTLLAFLPPGVALPAARLAGYHGVPEAYPSKHLQALVRAGVVASVSGPRGGSRLARSPDEITALDVVEAVDGEALEVPPAVGNPLSHDPGRSGLAAGALEALRRRHRPLPGPYRAAAGAEKGAAWPSSVLSR